MARRLALLAGPALVAALFGVALAAAQETSSPSTAPAPSENSDGDFSLSEYSGARFIPPAIGAQQGAPRQLELAFAAGGDGAPLDFALAQRASLGANSAGDIAVQGRGSELRVGRGLVERQGDARSAQSSVYMFVASDDEALTWQPGARGGQGAALALEERVEIGDVSAGVTFESSGVQASLAYVEREASTQIGRESYFQDESFTGVTVTVRR